MLRLEYKSNCLFFEQWIGTNGANQFVEILIRLEVFQTILKLGQFFISFHDAGQFGIGALLAELGNVVDLILAESNRFLLLQFQTLMIPSFYLTT